MKPLALSFLLLLALPTHAGPKDWLSHHKRFLLMEGAAVAGASIHAAGLHHCRRGDVERCDEGYGSAWAWYGVITATSTIVMPAVTEGCWKNGGGKFCYVFAYGASAYQAGQGIYDWRAQHKELRLCFHFNGRETCGE